MQVECLLDVVDVLRLAVSKEFQCLDLFPEVFDRFILLVEIQLVIQIVDINDLYGYNLLCSTVFTGICQSKPRIVHYLESHHLYTLPKDPFPMSSRNS